MTALPSFDPGAPLLIGGYDYFFADAEADERLGLVPALDALAAALPHPAAPADPALAWAVATLATGLTQPIDNGAIGDDGAPVLSLDPPATLVPLDRSQVVATLSNAAAGPLAEARVLASELRSLALETVLPALRGPAAPLGGSGAPLYRHCAAQRPRNGPHRPIPMEFAFAVVPLVAGRETGMMESWLRAGYRLSIPTAQGALTALGQLDREDFPSLGPSRLQDWLGADAVSRGFDRRTPLLAYLAVEAAEAGLTIGPLGVRLLAETFWGLLASPHLDGGTGRGPDRSELFSLWQRVGEPHPPIPVLPT